VKVENEIFAAESDDAVDYLELSQDDDGNEVFLPKRMFLAQ
jgi:hypothetical protein